MAGRCKYNWEEIQNYYDIGNSMRDVKNKFGMGNKTICNAAKLGKLKTRSRKEGLNLRLKKYGAPKHSEETKKKLSEIRIKYLTEHPDKVPYIINHSSKKSWPEEVFEKALTSEKIVGWEYKYRNGIYEYDFAFPNIKLDVEIDGGTHKTEKVKKIDERRDNFSRANGWTVVRFEAEEVKKDVKKCINILWRYWPLIFKNE